MATRLQLKTKCFAAGNLPIKCLNKSEIDKANSVEIEVCIPLDNAMRACKKEHRNAKPRSKQNLLSPNKAMQLRFVPPLYNRLTTKSQITRS